MNPRVFSILLLMLLLPLGCSTGSTGSSAPPSVVPDVTGNWVIETASIYTSTGLPASGVVLSGGLVSTGAVQNGSLKVTGSLSFFSIEPQTDCIRPQTLSFTGNVDAARNLTLTSETLRGGGVITVNMPLPATLSTCGTGGTIAVSQGACTQASAGVTGALQQPLNGTYTGSLSPGLFGMTTGAAVGTGTLVLAESPVAISGDTIFALSGTLSYTFGTCTGSVAISGSHTGVGFGLTGPLALPVTVQVGGGADSTANSLQIDDVEFASFPCPTNPTGTLVFSGTLTRQ